MFKLIKLARAERGDTIVEVMLVVAILGSAFATSYAIANASVTKNRNAQEHAEALQYINSELELLHNTPPDTLKGLATPTAFCMSFTDGKPVVPINASCSVGTDSRYNLVINYTHPSSFSDIFTVTVNWQGAGGLGPQREKIAYKLHVL